jgi:hypothetical protein
MAMVRAGTAILAAAVTLAGCGSSGTGIFGGPKQTQPVQIVDANAFPAFYKQQIATYLMNELSDRADFRNALIAPPTLKQVGDSQRYVVCLQFNGRNEHKNKVVIYFAGELQQYIDPTPEQCGDAAFQPYQELAAAQPH